MKKCMLILMSIGLIVLSSCSNKEKEVHYRTMKADWPTYSNVQELVDKANIVFTGRITGISFDVLDLETGLPATEETEIRHRDLYTIYTIETIDQYKGTVEGSSQVRILGGIKEYRTDEQMSLMSEMEVQGSGIPILEGSVSYTIGKTYLFVLNQFEATASTILNLDQSVYSLDDPFSKQRSGVKAFSDPAKYYAESVDESGNGIISAMDIIRFFGEDKWDTFWTKWKADHPNWETQLNAEAVQKALDAAE